MTLHQLKIFVVVARHLSLTNASEELHISEPSVSQQLKLLEEDLNVKLHTKVGRGIELTEQGRVFLKDAETIVYQTEKLKEKFSGGSSAIGAGSLRVGGSPNPSEFLLPSVLADFKRSHPLVQVNLRTDTKRAIVQMVSSGEVDITVVTNPPHCPDLVIEPYRREKIVLFTHVTHPLARKRELSVSELAELPLVIRAANEDRPSTTEEALRELERKGLKPRIAIRCESLHAVKLAVKRRMGLGILYEGILRPELRRGDFKVIRVKGLTLRGQSSILYQRERPLSASANDFINLLRQWRRKSRRY